MRDFYAKLKDNLGLSLILSIGLGVEFSNFQAMFFRFMLQYRPDWGAFNHLFAMLLSAFLLLCIVIFGIRHQTLLSWFLALLTCVISFSVYSRMELSWQWEQMNEVNFVVVILSGLLPLLVAYTTHLIAQTDKDNVYEIEDELADAQITALLQEIRRKHRQSVVHTTPQAVVASKRRHVMADKRPKDIVPDTKEIVYVKSCESCGEEFETSRKKAKYCTRTCSLQAQKQQRTRPTTTKVIAKKTTETPAAKTVVTEKNSPKVVITKKVAPPIVIEEEKEYSGQKKIKNDSIIKEDEQQTPHVVEQLTPHSDDDNIIYFNCDYCGKASTKTNQHSRYCSEVCRIGALRSRKKSDFFASRDEFDTEGFIEWTNPHNA